MLVHLSLGSNLGSRHGGPRETVLAGVEALGRGPLAVAARSRVYRTEPVGFAAQADFANLVVAADTELDPDAIVDWALAVEAWFGRRRTVKNGPRTLDVDLLSCGALVYASDRARVPHPRLHERRFVLEPLLEIAPDWVHPVTGAALPELLAALPKGERVELWESGSELSAGVG